MEQNLERLLIDLVGDLSFRCMDRKTKDWYIQALKKELGTRAPVQKELLERSCIE